MKAVAELLAKYEALSGSLELMVQYLEKARRVLRDFPPSDGRTGLLGLADYLASQTDALGAVCP